MRLAFASAYMLCAMVCGIAAVATAGVRQEQEAAPSSHLAAKVSKSAKNSTPSNTSSNTYASAGSHARAGQQTVLEYGDQCAREIGEICPFDCNSGTDIPITVDNKTPTDYTNLKQCDRPSLLVPDQANSGQCMPYSKVLNLSRGSTQISVYCRRNSLNRHPDKSHYFDEVDIVLHHTGSGKTCWFQSKAAPPHTPVQGQGADKSDNVGIDASRVPPPNERVAPAGHPSAVEFWKAPREVAAAQCASCHDAGPFIQSPYIAQVWNNVPTDPWGKYVNIGADFASWRRSWAISTPGNTCIGCHRIGDERSCSTYVPMSAGRLGSPANNAQANAFPLSHWMPTQDMEQDRWTAENIRSVNDILTCCADRTHKNPNCTFTPVMSAPPKSHWIGAMPADHACPMFDRVAIGGTAAH
ncbi:hypothetical protein [Pararobbsia alpina]|uniref:hypothetical protein n=1 Tax=Pararobbsia alpina TaxID=621374 RepID=UPI0039A6BB50